MDLITAIIALAHVIDKACKGLEVTDYTDFASLLVLTHPESYFEDRLYVLRLQKDLQRYAPTVVAHLLASSDILLTVANSLPVEQVMRYPDVFDVLNEVSSLRSTVEQLYGASGCK